MAGQTTVTYRADRLVGCAADEATGPTLMFENAAGVFGVSVPADQLPLLIEGAAALFSAPSPAPGEHARVRALNVGRIGLARVPDGGAYVLQYQLLNGGQINLGLTPEQLDQLHAVTGAALKDRAG